MFSFAVVCTRIGENAVTRLAFAVKAAGTSMVPLPAGMQTMSLVVGRALADQSAALFHVPPAGQEDVVFVVAGHVAAGALDAAQRATTTASRPAVRASGRDRAEGGSVRSWSMGA